MPQNSKTLFTLKSADRSLFFRIGEKKVDTGASPWYNFKVDPKTAGYSKSVRRFPAEEMIESPLSFSLFSAFAAKRLFCFLPD